MFRFLCAMFCLNCLIQPTQMCFGEELTFTSVEESRQYATGLKREILPRERGEDVISTQPLPEHFDWREEVPGGLAPVGNQGSCGSCVSWALTGVLENIVRIRFPLEQIDLSEQTLVSNCYRQLSCSGGYLSAASYLVSKGLPLAKDDPYLARNSACKNAPVAKQAVEWGYVKSPNTANLKAALVQYGPLSVTMAATSSFMRYRSGVYNNCTSGSTNHAVQLVGWTDAVGSVPGHWIVKNSWGSFGEQGYFRIAYTGRDGRKCLRLGEQAVFLKVAE